MKRIDIPHFNSMGGHWQKQCLAETLNEIMEYLEHMTSKNGKLFTCVNCQHATGFIGDLGKCCDNPLYEVSE